MDAEDRTPSHSHNHSPMAADNRAPTPPPKHHLTPTPPPKHHLTPTPPKHHLPEEHHHHKYPDEDYKHDGGRHHRHPRSTICLLIAVFLLLAGATALTVYLIYRPQNPKFTVLGVAVFNLNNTSPPYITTTMQFSLITRNPNKRVSIFYDHLSAFVTYHDQMITEPVTLPPLYHRKHSTVQMAPILGGGGNGVAVSSDAAYGLLLDEAYGVVGLKLVLVGKLRWKAGAIMTRRYGVYVNCDVLVRLNKGFVGQVPLVAPPKCDFDA